MRENKLESLTIDKLFIVPNDAVKRQDGKTFVGIDFGTSTTVVSIASFDEKSAMFKCQTLELMQQDKDETIMTGQLLPSVIAINPKNSAKLLIGEGAKSLKWDPSYVPNVNLFHSFKMGLGADMGQIWSESQYDAIRSPQDATRIFFQFLKIVIERAVKELGLPCDIEYAVSIPASFESNQRRDLLDALMANDIMTGKSVLIDEPNAAFLAYITPDESRKEPIKFGNSAFPKVLVFDFGAGTCDISILELSVDHNGLHSKNIAISQFQELGGNNIDEAIAESYLYPDFLKNNGKSEDEYRTSQKNRIVDQLRPIAEELKIKACKGLTFAYGDEEDFKAFIGSNKKVDVVRPITIDTDYGTLSQTIFELSYRNFVSLMKRFASKRSMLERFVSRMGGKTRTNVIDSVRNALTKAKLSEDDIDYIMLVGGSSKNPCVQHALADFFGERAKVLIPQELQYLVSRGAALHSLLFNGLGIQAVKPITSEPLMVITREGQQVILEAGTEIPFPPVSVDTLATRGSPTKVIEIPICVSNPNKMLFNLKMKLSDGAEFPPNTPIGITIEMGVDKILKVCASCMDQTCDVTAFNPFTNSSLTAEEKEIAAAQRAAYNSVSKGSGPDLQCLEKLAMAYEKAGKKLLAAETLVEIREKGGAVGENRIGILYAESGNRVKAMEWYRKAIAKFPNNPWPMSNLAIELMKVGKNDEALELFRRSLSIDPANYYTLYNMALIEKEEGYGECAGEHFKQAFTLLRRKCLEDDMDDVDWSWLELVAIGADKDEEGKELMKRKKSRKQDKGYNENNLAVLKGRGIKEV